MELLAIAAAPLQAARAENTGLILRAASDFTRNRRTGGAVEYRHRIETAPEARFPRRTDYSLAGFAVFAAGHL